MSRIAEAHFGDTPATFGGSTFDQKRDGARLTGQLERVFNFMSDGQWRSLGEIAMACGGTEPAISARLRDLRKHEFGEHTVERWRVAGGFWKYRLIRSKQP